MINLEQSRFAVFEELRNRLRADLAELDYFSFEGQPAELFPSVRWIAAYAVTGNNEGHYIHVDLIFSDGSREFFAIGKSFAGWDHAARIAGLIGREMGA